MAPPPPTWESRPPSQFERDYFQFVHALDLRAFSTRVQRSGLGTAALRILLIRVHGFMPHLGRAAWFQVLPTSCNHYGILALDAFTACLFEHEAHLFNDDGMWGEMHASMCVGRPWTGSCLQRAKVVCALSVLSFISLAGGNSALGPKALRLATSSARQSCQSFVSWSSRPLTCAVVAVSFAMA